MLAVQDEVVSLDTKAHCGPLAQEYEGEYISILRSIVSNPRLVQVSRVTNLVPAIEEELVGINAVRDGATNERHPMEDQRRLCRVSEEQLLEDVQQHSEKAA